MNRLLARLPAPLATPGVRASFWRWLGVGTAVRLLLLPIGISSDTLAIYWRAHVIAFDGDVYREYLVNMGSHALHALWLLVASPFLPPERELWTDPWWWSDPFGLIPGQMQAFLARPDAAQVIAVLKAPYALADLAAGVVLLALLWPRDREPTEGQARRIRRAWIFWMLSPAALYATMLFGRYESFPVLAVLVALLFAERDRPVAAAVTLGLAITLRTYPIVLVPVFAVVLFRDLPRQVGWSALALTPFAVTMLANRVVGGTFGEVAAVGEYDFGGNFFAFELQPDRGGPGVFLFVAVMLGLGAYLLGRQRGWFGSGSVPVGHLWRWVALAHLAVFAFSQFSAHYLMWLTPAIALLLGRSGRRGIVPLHLAQVVGVFTAAYLLWGGILFTGTLGGLGETARTLLPLGPPLPTAGGQQLANVAWTAFAVATVALALPLLLRTLQADARSRAPSAGAPG